ncbi:MAG TPA: SpoIVB peptidase S55 domain-containing protein [Polyangiaceae bacterium]|nr:SpoIVB peptidase S55 domain-containing protein [Polyangiaceae bacterium]
MRFPSLLLAAVVAGLLLPLPLGLSRARADGLTSRADVMPVKDIKRGMKGYGLTVFEGTKPERFDVEVIDVLSNFRPRQDLILIKTKHPRLEVAKVVAGMSGSPIYLDGKMIGAYAYGWTFGSEPVAGVTPIRNMLDDLVRPLPNDIYGWPLRLMPEARKKSAAADGRQGGLTPDSGTRLAAAQPNPGARYARFDLQKRASELAEQRAANVPSASSALTPVATPLLVGGMTPSAVGMARSLLSPMGIEPLQAGGSGAPDPNAPTRFVDGGAIGVQLVRGDMSATGLGTVTRVEGERLVAFGHPMMESGITALPTAIGKVLWFLANDQRSFKIGMPVRELGALVNDRMASIVVSQSLKAPVIPVSMKIQGVAGLASGNWNFEVAHERFLSPSFVAVALGSALQAVAAEKQDVSWTATSTLKIKGYGQIQLEDYGVAIGGTPDAGELGRSNLVRAIGAIMNNPWEPAFIESASMNIELRFAREILRLRGVDVLDPEVDAGQPARLRLTFVPFAGPEVTRVVTVNIPAHLAGQTVNLELLPGYLEDREDAAPDTLRQLIQNLETPSYPAKSLVVVFSAGSSAVSFKGRVAKNLPPGALDALRPTATSIAPDAFQTSVRQVVPLKDFVIGRDKVSVTVRPVLR